MNYLVLNGVKSTTIKGLLIRSLPPITKPLIRTQIEEIDGRDGDIVTVLGYSAYDKEVSIGLYGDYDVDQCIEYFNSEGIVCFSNEPDKLYRYQIIEQIDFERLLRFKEATVTLHVQPFKYSAVDNLRTLLSSPKVVHNVGNIYSRPRYTVYGDGQITLYIDGKEVLSINMTGIEKIIIDSESMEAYDGNVLLNRRVSGDYDDLRLSVGRNIISWTGAVTRIDVENYSRWI